MNKYERYVVGKQVRDSVVVVSTPDANIFYCYRCARALWEAYNPEDGDDGFFRPGRAYRIIPDFSNAFPRNSPATCGHTDE